MGALGEYAVKAIAAGVTLVKLLQFIKTDEQSIELTREEVEAILMTIREQSTELKHRS